MTRRMLVLALAAVAGLALTGSIAAENAPQSPNIDEIIARNITARGGRDAILAVKNIRQEARMISMTMPGNEVTTVMFLKRPNWSRQDIEVNGQKIISGFDGKQPWIINPLTGSKSPIILSGPQADAIREQATFDPLLYDYRYRWTLVDFVARETLGERPVYHLRITSPSRQVSHLYLDAETGLEAKLMQEVDRAKMEVTWEDYRDVGGVKFAFLQRRIVNGVVQDEMRFQKIETNVVMSDEIFRVPKG